MFKECMENLMGINLCISVFNTRTYKCLVCFLGVFLFFGKNTEMEHFKGIITFHTCPGCVKSQFRGICAGFARCLVCLGACGADRSRCRERRALCEVWAVGPLLRLAAPHVYAGQSSSPTLAYALRASPSNRRQLELRR